LEGKGEEGIVGGRMGRKEEAKGEANVERE